MSNIIANILGSQSNGSSIIFRSYIDFKEYIDRVEAAGGTVISEEDTLSVMKFLLNSDLFESTKLLFLSNGGCIQRVDGLLKYYRTAYDMSNENKDLDGSVIATAQPRLIGGIAPNSKYAASNQNGEVRYFTHTPISFAASDAWSVTTVFNWNGSLDTNEAAYGDSLASAVSLLFLRYSSANNLLLVNSLGSGIIAYAGIISGKNYIVTYIADGLGNISLFINGVLISTVTNKVTSINFKRLLGGSVYKFNGNISFHRIQSGAMTAAQVLSEATFLRTKYPEIESVVIGTQEWSTRNFEAVATPLGNVIPNVTENGAVEKITNAADREFSSDTGFWTKSGETTISGGAVNLINTLGGFNAVGKTGLLTVNKWYKLTYEIISNSGGSISTSYLGGGLPSTIGSKVFYGKATLSTFDIVKAGIGTIVLDNISIQELNWSNATEIYDAVYAATAGDAATKEYAALKEAAMWCYYGSTDAERLTNGAIYGKLYNWYAAKLLDLDIVAYNAANPSAPWGWRVPTSAQFTTLATYLDGTSVAGGKMKMTGLDYWNTPNTGATNESGFTALGGGLRLNDTGLFSGLLTAARVWSIDKSRMGLNNSDSALSFVSAASALPVGYSVRLIKTP